MQLNPHTLHISLYDLLLFGIIFTGSTIALQLWFVKSSHRAANRLLSLTLMVVVLWMIRLSALTYLPYWNGPPLQFSLALGPFIYFYVVKMTRAEYKFRGRDWLHFSPLLPEFAANYDRALVPIVHLAAFFSVSIYLYLSHRQIEFFYREFKFNADRDRYRNELHWLQRLLTAFGLLWLLWMPFAVACYWGNNHPDIHTFYFICIFLATMLIWIGASALFRPRAGGYMMQVPVVIKTSVQADLRQKGAWLKKAMETRLFYRDSELSLSSLAEKLDIQPHELSRIINIALKKNFNDFVNEYRVRDVARKMQDPACDHITLLGIAFECGFNSKTTFNRTFKQMTGKSPAEYKNELKKERPNYNLERFPRFTTAILNQETTFKWTDEKLNRNYMFKNYLKIAWRNLIRNKVYSALNIAGLATGMAVALLIGLWVYSQYSYDKFLPSYDQLYQVKLNFYLSNQVETQSGSSIPLIDVLKKNYPEVQYASERNWGGPHSLVAGDKKLDPQGFAVGADFLKMFPFPFIKGNPNSVFADPNSIILTQSVAKALFGDQDPMNKIIRIDNQNNVKVTGVMKDVPTNSTVQFDFLLPYSFLSATDPRAKNERTNWLGYSTPEYVELKPGTDADVFQNKIKDIVFQHAQDKTTRIEVILQPAKNWHLLNQFKDGKAVDGFITYVRMFGIIGILVLVIACINFVNLSTARAEKRAREVGVRKSIGSLRRDLVVQFLTESLLITFMAFALSLLLVQLVLPSFNTLIYGNITIPYLSGVFWCVMIGYVLVTGLLAGSRPAFYLSSFKPVKVLKGTIQLGKKASLPRKIMVAVQFTCSIALIISTLIIYQQLQYAKNRPKGYDTDRLIFTDNSADLQKNYTAFKHDLLQSGEVTSVTSSGSSMTYMPAEFAIQDFPGKKPGESLGMATTAVSPDYFKTVGMTFAAGHDFENGALPDTLNVVINEAAAKTFRLKDPIGQLIRFEYTKNSLRIIGVVKNAIIGSPFYSAMPSIYVYNPGWGGAILYRLKPGANTQQALGKIGKIFDKYNPSYPFSYHFADQAYDSSFQLESLMGLLAGIFAGLAIFISCLGLFGLAAYVAEQRKKEIGIRKVMGASVRQVWVLLSGDFIKLVLISCVIASPVALYFLHGWLQKYDYRISIGPWVFVFAAVITLAITVITVSWQAISSALTNPVKSLRSE